MGLASSLVESEIEKGSSKKRGAKPSIVALLDSYLRTKDELSPFKVELSRNKVKGFHPSGLNSESCPRKIAFGYIYERGLFLDTVVEDELHFTNQPNEFLALTFDIGHVLHCLIQYSYLRDIYGKSYGTDCKVEVPVMGLHEKYLISGTTDLILKLQDGKTYLGDIKTANSNSFERMKKENYVGDGYMTQINLYMLGAKVSRGFFLIINKDRSSKLELFVNYDKEYVREPLKIATIGKEMLEGKQMPDMLRGCKKADSTFENCDYSSMCMQCKNNKDLLSLTKVKSNNKIFEV